MTAKRKNQVNTDLTTEISITAAKIKDDFCEYSYEIAGGKSIGFTHNVKGKGIIDDDLRNAFAKLNVHLAVVDDVFKHAGVTIDSISTMHNDELTMLYNVTEIKVKGGEENESVILIGNKYLSGGSRMELEGPKVAIDSLSSYKWYNELKEATDKVREEVLAYHNGKYTVVNQIVIDRLGADW